MCPTSITKLECFNKSCQFYHIKGTKREPGRTEQHDKAKLNSPNNDSYHPLSQTKSRVNSSKDDNNNDKNFLEIVRILKAELTAMDKKITSVLTQVNNSQPKPWQTSMMTYNPAMFQHSQVINPHTPNQAFQQLLSQTPMIPVNQYPTHKPYHMENIKTHQI